MRTPSRRGRVLTDFLRVDKTWFGLTGSQWTSIAAILLSIGLLVRYAMRPGPGPQPVLAGGEPGSVEGEPGPVEGEDQPPGVPGQG